MVLQTVVLILIIAFPQTVTYLVDLSTQYQLNR
jgi:hypothetical protein